jgi:spore maturation protein CgeB
MRILYVGPLWPGGTCFQRIEAMKGLGHEVVPVDTEPAEVWDRQKHLFQRLRRKLVGPPDLAGANQRICRLIKEGSFDVLWLDKGLTITRETLRLVRRISAKMIIAGYAPDDMAAKHNQSRAFLKALPLYHVYFTTKSYGVKELEFQKGRKSDLAGQWVS